ncbi:MAG: VCBS repeat-containing protein [Planctomycetota bacterium]
MLARTFGPIVLASLVGHAQAQTAAATNLGGGASGTTYPTLAFDGAPVVGGPLGLRIERARPSSVGVIGIGLTHVAAFDPIYAATIHPGAPYYALAIAPTDARGTSPTLHVAPVVQPSFAGIRFWTQALVADPLAQNGLAFGDGLEVRLGEAARPLGETFPTRVLAGVTDAVAVEAADVDGDGTIDLVVATSTAFSVHRGLGDRTFELVATYPSSLVVPFGVGLAVADVDGDGAPDVVLSSGDLYLNDGSGSFAAAPTVLEPGRDTVLADLDGDGALDHVFTQDFTLGVQLGAGDGTFAPAVTTGVGGQAPYELTTLDVDTDGKLDVVLLAMQYGTPSVYLGNGDGTLAAPLSISSTGSTSGLALADFDEDGVPDVATVSQFGGPPSFLGYVQVRTGLGTGLFSTPASYPLFDEMVGLRAGDFDGDGHHDLVVGARGLEELAVLRGHGDGTFDTTTFGYGPTGDLSDLVVADLDADGDLDVVSVAGQVRLLFGGGDGSFGVDGSVGLPAGPAAIALADLDRDGNLDVVSTFFGFGVAVNLGSSDDTFGAATAFANGLLPANLLTVDVDLDGAVDVVAIDRATDQLVVLLGNGDGTLAPPSPVLPATTARPPAVGDVDGDGLVDVVTVDSLQGSFVVHVGQGDGTFVAGPANPLAGADGTPHLVDLDGDGDLDLVLVDSSGTSFVHVLAGLGGGVFAAPTSVTLSKAPAHVRFGDVDGDGLLDLFVAATTGGFQGSSIHLGTPGPSFGAGATSSGLVGSELADVDGDGRLDLVTLLGTSLGIEVRPGDGTGSFGAPLRFAAGAFPSAVAAGDVDGDGVLDVVVGNERSRDLTVLVNRRVD